MIKRTIAEELRAKQSRDNRELLDQAAAHIENLEREREALEVEIMHLKMQNKDLEAKAEMRCCELQIAKAEAIKAFAFRLRIKSFMTRRPSWRKPLKVISVVKVIDIDNLEIEMTEAMDEKQQ